MTAMISRFFIDRPIFAAVLSIVITFAGLLALWSLPMAQYPPITPPSVQVSISYPGASAQVVADTVAAPIEQQVNGVEGMLYMSSQSGNDGSYTLTVTFDLATNLNTAMVMVQNRVQLAMPLLPTAVQMQGITIRKKTPDILNVVNLYSPDGRYDELYLSNFAKISLRDELLRLDGVSDVLIFGERDYSIRAWLDPQKLAAANMTALDVASAVQTQNVAAAPGQLGQPPTNPQQSLQPALDTLGRLTTPEQFGAIIIKVGQGGAYQATSGTAGGGTVGTASLTGGDLGGSPGGTISMPAAGGTGSVTAPPSQPGSGAGASGLASGTTTSGGVIGGLNPGIAGSGLLPSPVSGGLNPGLITGMTAGSSGAGLNPGLAGGSPGPSLGAAGGVNTSGPGSPSPTPTAPGVTPAAGTTVAPPTAYMAGTTPSPVPRGPAASIVRLRDVARVELGAQNYNQSCTFDGHASAGLGVFQLPGTNALDVGNRVHQKMKELKARFPQGVDYDIAYDITPYVRDSVMDVVWTLLEAVGLVAVVVLLFLQNWRSALIPLIAVPVAIIGTFAVMAGLTAAATASGNSALVFSLNNISLFGLVLAIGIVVDDAIVVVENVERWLEQGLPPREAARRAMDEVTGPVIAVALVLSAVFVPCAFIGGITGQFFRQFAVTISASTIFSAINSLTLSPALAALLLRPHAPSPPNPLSHGGERGSKTNSPLSPGWERGAGGVRGDPVTRVLDFLLGWLFRGFNAVFRAGTAGYARLVGWLLRGTVLVLLGYGGLLFLTYLVFMTAPMGFVPEQDQGRLILSVQLPDSASLRRTDATLALVQKIVQGDPHDREQFPGIPGVAHTVAISGMSFVLSINGSNLGSMFIVLDPFEKRQKPELSANAIAAKMRREFARHVKDGVVIVFPAPPIPGLSVAGGFKLMVEDRGSVGVQFLQKQTDALVARLRKQPDLVSVSTQFRARTPQLFMDVDRTKVASLGVPLNDVNQTMQIYLGSTYVNSFNAFGRYWQVILQAKEGFRSRTSDVNLLAVRNQWGEMVPLGTLVDLRRINGPIAVLRYNLYTAAPITGNIRPGTSSGQAIAAVDEQAVQILPRSMSTEWTELMFMEIRAGNTAFYVFALAVVFVFLALAALYESWGLPLAVILVVPLCLLCSIGGVRFTDRSVDIFVQIGLVVLVGLACKNAILVVEFAQALRRQGRSRHEATVEASRLRLRPILMTSLAFILGVVPLVVATGAGAEMRRSLGTAVFSGMLGVTVFGIFLTPVFFSVIQWLSETPLFAATATRWVGSCVLGGVLGLAVGYVLAALGAGREPWAAAVGGVVGAILALLIPALWRRVRQGNHGG
jgi:multidrug efflux pump